MGKVSVKYLADVKYLKQNICIFTSLDTVNSTNCLSTIVVSMCSLILILMYEASPRPCSNWYCQVFTFLTVWWVQMYFIIAFQSGFHPHLDIKLFFLWTSNNHLLPNYKDFTCTPHPVRPQLHLAYWWWPNANSPLPLLTLNSIVGKRRPRTRCPLRSSDVNQLDNSGKVLFKEIYLIIEAQIWKIKKKINTGNFHSMKYVKLISKPILSNKVGFGVVHKREHIHKKNYIYFLV